MNKIYDYLESLIKDPKPELNFNKDYELVIAVMLSAQTTDKRVNQVTEILFSKYDNLSKLASASYSDIENIIRPLGTYKKKSINVIEIAKSLKELDKVPNDRNYLESLPGVGRKTANVVLSEIYKEPTLAVDTHVQRVAKRLNIAKETDDVLVIEKKLYKYFQGVDIYKLHHLLLLFGRYYCKSKNPQCTTCGLRDICKYYKNKT